LTELDEGLWKAGIAFWRIMRREPESIVAVEIIYETHSTTIDNESGIATGWLPGKLSENGREQARALGERRRGMTSQPCSCPIGRGRWRRRRSPSESDVPIYQDARLRECNYGVMNGMSVA
jgi:broad specificity phosphatase PhoE